MKPKILEFSFEFSLDFLCPSWGRTRRKSNCPLCEALQLGACSCLRVQGSELCFCGEVAVQCTYSPGAVCVKAPMVMFCYTIPELKIHLDIKD